MSLTSLNEVISFISRNNNNYYYCYYYYHNIIVYHILCNSRCSCPSDSNKTTTLIGQGEMKIAYPFVEMVFKFSSLE